MIHVRERRQLFKHTDEEIVNLALSLPETCALDVADNGEHTLQEIAVLMELTRQRVQQQEAGAIGKLRLRIMARRSSIMREYALMVQRRWRL